MTDDGRGICTFWLLIFDRVDFTDGFCLDEGMHSCETLFGIPDVLDDLCESGVFFGGCLELAEALGIGESLGPLVGCGDIVRCKPETGG